MSYIFLTSLWLGIVTAISPCPLATNIAAISFIGRNSGKKNQLLLSGFLYSVGRTLAYFILGFAITRGALEISESSLFLQKYVNEALGPILIILGLILLGWIGNGLSLSFGTKKLEKLASGGSMFWAVPIGFIFALSFCPVSAGLFFGALIPLAIKQQSTLLSPVMYGIGTSLPVIIFAFIMAFASSYVGKTYNKITQIEQWVRYFAGAAFILAGIYYTIQHIYL